jgi:hypothetical protein
VVQERQIGGTTGRPPPVAARILAAMAQPLPAGRDLRLDLFRGLALWLIFIDHVPGNLVSWLTIRHYGFSDATEIFVFISGYTAAFVYGREMRERGFVVGGARILRRAWQVYVAHIFLFMLYVTEVAYVSRAFENPLYGEELGLLDFFQQPDSTLIQSMILRFQPANINILPLYIVLLLGFPPTLWLLLRAPSLALGASAILYLSVRVFGLQVPTYPQGIWYFNPLAWQFLFVFGAWCALGGAARFAGLIGSRPMLVAALGYIALSFAISFVWNFPTLEHRAPRWLSNWIFSVDKTRLDPERFLHFVALAIVTVRFVTPDWPPLESRWLRPIIRCGQHSLEIFCLGQFLSFAGHFVIVETSGGPGVHVAISVVGIAAMVATAVVIDWYKHIEGRTRAPRTAATGDLVGG